ncbi:MAG: phage head-tail connector protein [Methylocystis sp.]|uniref:head-tail connector protein n=1 Tax=Methylocystis sp. TaxID=1911079 RepID=UPI003D114AA0
MRPMLFGAPAIEPVSLADAKSWLREDGAEEDQLIQALIVAARMTLEAYTRRFFITQSWRLIFDGWPSSVAAHATLYIPFAPFQAVTAARVFDADDVAQTLAAPPIARRPRSRAAASASHRRRRRRDAPRTALKSISTSALARSRATFRNRCIRRY